MEASFAVALLPQATMLTNDRPSFTRDADSGGSKTTPNINHNHLIFATQASTQKLYIDHGNFETAYHISAKYANDLSILDAESYFYTTDSMVVKEARREEAVGKKARRRPGVNTMDETAIDVSRVKFAVELRPVC
jgi:hypothetical protein